MLINAEGMDAAMTLHTGSSESNASTWRDVTLINNPCTVSSRSSKSSQPESVIVIDVHDHSVTSTIRSYGSSLTSAVAPLVYTMRACGLMHTRHRTCRLSASLCYSLIVMLCLVLNCTRLFWGYYTTERNFRHQLFGRITVHVWTFLSVVGSLMCFMLSKCFPTIARRWNENSPLQESASFKSLRRWSLGGVLLCGFLFIGTAGLAVAYVAGFKNKYQEIASLYFHKKNPSLTFTIFYIFSVLFTEVAWSMSWCAYVIVAMAFKKLFEENHKELQKCIDADGSFIGCIGEIRQRHENICKAVDLADKALSVFTFVVLVTQFTILCYATHNVVRTGLHGISLAVHISVILFCLLHLAALSVIGCKLNKAATAHSATLYDVKVAATGMGMAELTEYQTFLGRVTNGRNIGLSAMKLFYVNTKTVTIMFLLFLGYVAALICTGYYKDVSTAHSLLQAPASHLTPSVNYDVMIT